MDAAHFEKTLSSEVLFEGRVVTLTKDVALLENGETSIREVVHHHGGACIVPYFEDGTLCMVRQFRYAMQQELWELPAGKLEKGEDPFEAAKRELGEECGLTADHYTPLGEFYPTVGYDTEIIYMWVATGLHTTQMHLDDDEFLTPDRIPLAKAYEMVMSGEIKDGKTIAGVLKLKALVDEVHAAGLELEVIESVNVHEDIKTGLPTRDEYIQHYIDTIRNLARYGIKVIVYNFMPVFDWTRTELARVRPDGSTVLAYKQSAVDALVPEKMFESIAGDANGAILPGWEPERMAKVKELFDAYRDVDDEKLFANLKYFLERIMPVCNEYDIRMAIHPDDPAWSVFGLPRIIINKENILRMMKMVDDPHNGMTFCSGSYGTNLENDLPDMIRSLKGRIHFAHVRNLKFHSQQDFEEAAHLSSDGSFDMYEIMKALYDIGFDGIIRPDHGRAIWGEVSMPGYGLYDRALGACYLNGLWEAIVKQNGNAHQE